MKIRHIKKLLLLLPFMGVATFFLVGGHPYNNGAPKPVGDGNCQYADNLVRSCPVEAPVEKHPTTPYTAPMSLPTRPTPTSSPVVAPATPEATPAPTTENISPTTSTTPTASATDPTTQVTASGNNQTSFEHKPL